MRAEDIEQLVSVGRPTIARDGSFAVFATSRPSIAGNRDVGRLFRVDLDTGEIRPLTRGIADRAPWLSPDGGDLAFLRSDAKDKPQIWVVESLGGEPVQVTDAPLGVQSFDWSPNGSQLTFVARVPERGRYGTVEGLDAAAEAPRRITGIRWHANGVGFTGDRPSHVFVVEAPDLSAEPRVPIAPAVLPEGEDPPDDPVVVTAAVQLTSGSTSYASAVFSADGTEVLAVADDIENSTRDLRTPLVAVRVDGGGMREVVERDSGLSISDVCASDDGVIALLAFEAGPAGSDFIAPPVALWLVADDGVRRLTDPEDLDLGEVGSHLTAVDDDFLVQDRARGRVRLLRVTRGGDVSEVLGGDVEVDGHASAGDRVVAAVKTPTSYGELLRIDRDGPSTLTAFGPAASDVIAPREVEITARDGYPVHGWVAKPAGGGTFPVILQIHGGPYAQYGVHLFDETQVLVAAGYAVVYCNPRASAGYGRTHGRSIRRAMGTVDFTDILDFLEGVLAGDEELDGSRVGIMGGSYGGYLTAWAIAHEHRFAAAIVERGFLEPRSFQGTSDIGSFFGDEYVGVTDDDIARQSPMAVADQVTTPTLVMHSELDFRCPLEQATRYYTALIRQGTQAELLVFPGEDHELTRSGRPRHRVERFAAVRAWWERFLPV